MRRNGKRIMAGVWLAAGLTTASAAWGQAATAPEELERQTQSLASPVQSQATTSEAASSKPDLLIAPIPMSNPALGTGAALAAVLYYNPNHSPDPWVSAVAIGYTSTKTWAAGFSHTMALDNDRFRIAGYGDARLNYYGIGSDAGEAGTSVKLRDRGFSTYLDGQVRLFDKGLLSHLHIGLRISYLRVRSTIDLPPLGDRELEIPPFELRSGVASLGPSFTFDTRDKPFNPRKGVYVTGTWMMGQDFLGSDYTHRKFEFLSNGYFPLGKGTVLGVRKTLCAVKGDAPYYDLCMFGRNGDLRGYEAGRYRDGATWALQAEVRQKVSGKLGMVGFFGVGGLAASSADIWKHSYVLLSGGYGLRYLASKANNVNLRLDMAWGRDGPTAYFGIGEAF